MASFTILKFRNSAFRGTVHPQLLRNFQDTTTWGKFALYKTAKGGKKGRRSTSVQRATASSHGGGASEFENFSRSPADVHGQVREKPIKARSTND